MLMKYQRGLSLTSTVLKYLEKIIAKMITPILKNNPHHYKEEVSQTNQLRHTYS